MSDQLTEPAATAGTAGPTAPARRSLRPSLVQALVVLVLFCAAGAALGLLWERLWDPTEGMVVRHEWFVVDDQLRYDLDGLRNQFSGTGLFVLISLAAGLVLGVLSALLLARDEVVTMLAVALGAALGAVVMWQVGSHLGPPDPEVLAATAKRGTVLPDDLELGSPGALLAMPFAGLLGLCAVFLLVPGRSREATP
jgi:hypothetical protein